MENCTATECAYELSVSNRVLALLHIAPYTELKLRFGVTQGRVAGSMLDYRTISRSGASTIVHVQTDYCSHCGYVYVNPWVNSSPDRDNGIVQVGANASADKRNIAMGIDPDCLTKFNGCRDIAQLLSTVWGRTANGNTMCRVHNRTGQVDW